MHYSDNLKDNLKDNIIDLFKINLLANNKTNTNTNMIQTIIIIVIFSFISNYLKDGNTNISFHISKNKINSLFMKKNKIIIEGKRCFKSTDFSTRNQVLFGHTFKAIFSYIHKNINSKDIYSIKEYTSEIYDSDSDCDDNYYDNDKLEKTLYIINQRQEFEIEKNIFCTVNIDKQTVESGGNSRTLTQFENIEISIYSYNESLKKIKTFIENITNKYMICINKQRHNKLFIYNYEGQKETDDYRSRRTNKGESNSIWSECLFTSNRNFNNIFFDEKERLIEKIDFFINNKEWYEKEGHPYTLGIGLSGPPGTGKTSIIKSIANKLRRHLIVIPLNKIKTMRELSECFFEEKYNYNKKDNSITFDNKIIIFEDIDCMIDIVKDRNEKNNQNDINYNVKKNDNDKEDLNTKEIISAVVKGMKKNNNSDNSDNGDNEDLFYKIEKKKDDKINLAFLLNLIDGIRETPGRIIIITSNYYNKLDAALKRPGRIDITLNMKNASHKTLYDIYQHYYNKEFPSDKRDIYKDGTLSPAQLVNIRLNSKNSDEYIENLINYFNV